MFGEPLRCTCAEDESGLPCDYCVHVEKTMTPAERTARQEQRRAQRAAEFLAAHEAKQEEADETQPDRR